MSLNRFFNNLLDILPLSKARSAQVEANFTAVADGFTLAQAEIEAKLPLAGGAMTGDIAMGGKKVTGLAAPSVASDAVTLGHVTTLFGSTSSAAASAESAATQANLATSNGATQVQLAVVQAELATTKAGEAATSAGAAAASAASIAAGPVASVRGMVGVVVSDTSGGIPGLTLFKLNLKNALGTITNFFTSATTAARTWVMPDKDGTVAMTSDILADQTSIVGISGTTAQFNTALTDGEFATLSGAEILSNKTATGLKETKVSVSASAIDLSAGNYFSKTAASTLTWTVSNVPATGTAASFILDLTNGGSAAQTWWTGVKWAGGTAPTLTAAGRDVLGFFTHDGGTTWTGLVLARDVK